jgi:hypothetical protein
MGMLCLRGTSVKVLDLSRTHLKDLDWGNTLPEGLVDLMLPRTLRRCTCALSSKFGSFCFLDAGSTAGAADFIELVDHGIKWGWRLADEVR